MQLHIRSEKDKVVVPADVTKIEVSDIVTPPEEEIVGIYFRTIRFVSSDGEAIEVSCSARDKEELRVHACCCGNTALENQ
jgi:hypothetical protein